MYNIQAYKVGQSPRYTIVDFLSHKNAEQWLLQRDFTFHYSNAGSYWKQPGSRWKENNPSRFLITKTD